MSYGKDVKDVTHISSLLVVGGAVVLIGFAVIGFGLYKVLAPLQEQVRYNTFEQSQAFNERAAEDLAEAMTNYNSATPDQKDGIRLVINHRYANYDASKLPDALRNFLVAMRGY